jgi:alcohol dehydrogenase class IV
MVPHGMSVALTAPPAFRFTFRASPDRHIRAARLLAPSAPMAAREEDHLPAVLIGLMRDIGLPNGIGAVGYTTADIPDLVDGAMKQQRLLATAPRPVSEVDLAGILAASVELW